MSKYLRKWLKLNKNTSSLSFYSASSPCQLPIKSLTSVLKLAKISGHLLLSHSKDPSVSSSNIKLKSGEWDVSAAVNVAKNEIEF